MSLSPRTAVYPGSFDPVTNGHMDIIRRARPNFDKLIVGVLENASKETLFSPAERVKMIEDSLVGMDNIEVTVFGGLLVDFMDTQQAGIIIRGLRFVSDFEYELQMALMNQSLSQGVETFFMVAQPERTFVSSSLVKEIARQGRDTVSYVSSGVADELKKRFSSL